MNARMDASMGRSLAGLYFAFAWAPTPSTTIGIVSLRSSAVSRWTSPSKLGRKALARGMT